jgi:uncharacterized protein DUF1552
LVTRRQLLKRTGAAAAWPLAGRLARAAGPAPLRLILWPALNGADPQYFWPNPGNLSAMSMVTAPLAPYQKQITFLRGLDVAGSFNHMAVRSIFTGFPIADYASPDPNVKSLDQVVADYFESTAPTPLKSLHLGAIPADSLALYQLYGRSTFFFSPKPVDYEANPVTAFDRIFKGVVTAPMPVTPGPGTTPAPMPAGYDNEVLDLLDAELGELGSRLRDSPNEWRKLDQHRAAVKGLRPTARPGMSGGGGGGGPILPAKCDGSALASVETLRPSLQGKPAAAYQHQYFSDIFDAQIDIISRAVVCGLTRVATLQAGSADGNVTDPVGPGYPHHMTSHGNQMIFAQCQNWYASKFLRLLKSLDVPDPLDPAGNTVLFNSAIVWMSECLPVGHESTSVPAFVAGNAGGALKAGGYLDVHGATNKALLQTLATMLGAPTSASSHFGGQAIAELRA